MLQLGRCQLNFFFLCLQAALQNGMERVQLFFLKNKCRLPLSPSLVAKELNIKVLHIQSFKIFCKDYIQEELLQIVKKSIEVLKSSLR